MIPHESHGLLVKRDEMRSSLRKMLEYLSEMRMMRVRMKYQQENVNVMKSRFQILMDGCLSSLRSYRNHVGWFIDNDYVLEGDSSGYMLLTRLMNLEMLERDDFGLSVLVNLIKEILSSQGIQPRSFYKLKMISFGLSNLIMTKFHLESLKNETMLQEPIFNSDTLVREVLKVRHNASTPCMDAIDASLLQGSLISSVFEICVSNQTSTEIVADIKAGQLYWNGYNALPILSQYIQTDGSLNLTRLPLSDVPLYFPEVFERVETVITQPPPNGTIFNCLPGHYGSDCLPCPVGTWSNDGYLRLCTNAPIGKSLYTRPQESTPNCDFICSNPGKYRLNNECRDPPIGMYPLTVQNNSVASCLGITPWTFFVSPGLLANPYSCNQTYRALLNSTFAARTLSYWRLDLKWSMMKPFPSSLGLLESPHLWIDAKIFNSSIIYKFTHPASKQSITMDEIPLDTTDIVLKIVYTGSSIVLLHNDILRMGLISFPIGTWNTFNIGQYGLLKVVLHRFKFYQDRNFENLVSDAVAGESPLNCLNSTLSGDGKTCQCYWGDYKRAGLCVSCPYSTLGSISPRTDIRDCLCPFSKYMHANGSCVLAKESFKSPSLALEGFEVLVDQYLPSVKINMTDRLGMIHVTIWKNYSVVYESLDYRNNHSLVEQGEYFIISSQEEYGRMPGALNSKSLRIVKLIPLPIISPDHQVNHPTRLQISLEEMADKAEIRYSMDGSTPNELYDTNTYTFIKPGDVLRVRLVTGPDFVAPSNEIRIEYTTNTTTIEKGTASTARDWCWYYSTHCYVVIFTGIGFGILPLIILILTCLTLVYRLRPSKKLTCSQCPARATLRCLDCEEDKFYCNSCYVNHPKTPFHRVIGTNNVYIALYDFDPIEKREISLTKGRHVEVHLIHGPGSSRGWWYGENHKGETGFFPAAYIRKVLYS